MHWFGRIAALVVALGAIGTLAFVYAGRAPAPQPTASGPAAAVTGGAPLHLRLSPRLAQEPRAPAPTPSSILPLALGAAALCAFAVAFRAGAALRRQRAEAGAAADPCAAADPVPALADAGPDDTIEILAAELEAREAEVSRLRKEIEDWQDAWRLAKPRLTEQQQTIEDLQAELAAARSVVSGLRRYVAELQQARAGHAETRFADEVDAWIARFMRPAPPPAA